MTAEPRKNVRSHLRATADNADEAIARALMEALVAEKTTDTTITCKHCFKQGRYPVEVKDHANAIRAAEKLVELGYGRAASDSETALGCLTCSEVKSMDEEMIERGMVGWLTAKGYSVNTPRSDAA